MCECAEKQDSVIIHTVYKFFTHTFVYNVLPECFHQCGIVVSCTVDNGQFTLCQLKLFRKLPIQLQVSSVYKSQVTFVSLVGITNSSSC